MSRLLIFAVNAPQQGNFPILENREKESWVGLGWDSRNNQVQEDAPLTTVVELFVMLSVGVLVVPSRVKCI